MGYFPARDCEERARCLCHEMLYNIVEGRSALLPGVFAYVHFMLCRSRATYWRLRAQADVTRGSPKYCIMPQSDCGALFCCVCTWVLASMGFKLPQSPNRLGAGEYSKSIMPSLPPPCWAGRAGSSPFSSPPWDWSTGAGDNACGEFDESEAWLGTWNCWFAPKTLPRYVEAPNAT